MNKPTTEEAIEWFEGRKAGTTMPGANAMYDKAITALRAQAEAEKNDPITLEELRKMNGEPVFILSLRGKKTGEWKVVRRITDTAMDFTDKTSRYIPNSSPNVPCYGRTWLAYRRKQEEGK